MVVFRFHCGLSDLCGVLCGVNSRYLIAIQGNIGKMLNRFPVLSGSPFVDVLGKLRTL